VRPRKLIQALRWLKVNNPVYANINIRLGNYGLPEDSEDSEEPVLPDQDFFDSLDATFAAQSSAETSDPSDAAASNHTNAQREDDDTMALLLRNADGTVQIRQLSAYVSESASDSSTDSLVERADQLQKFIVSDAMRFGNEFGETIWIQAFPNLFPFGRYVSIQFII
jgi:hypothetical protein